MLSTRDSPQNDRYTQTKSKGMEKDILCIWKFKKVGIAICISEKIDFKTEAILKDLERHYIMIKGTTQLKDITLEIIYTPNTGRPKYMYINDVHKGRMTVRQSYQRF